jgi:hypothetical protein
VESVRSRALQSTLSISLRPAGCDLTDRLDDRTSRRHRQSAEWYSSGDLSSGAERLFSVEQSAPTNVPLLLSPR